MNDLVGIRRKLGNYALGHGGHFEVAKAGNVLRVTVDFHVHEIGGAMLAASVFLEFYRYACEHHGRFISARGSMGRRFCRTWKSSPISKLARMQREIG